MLDSSAAVEQLASCVPVAMPPPSTSKPIRVYEDDGKTFHVMDLISVRPSQVRFSQDSINSHFAFGWYRGRQNCSFTELYEKVAKQPKRERKFLHGIAPIRVVARPDGDYMTHDNRRLCVYRNLEIDGWLPEMLVELVSTPIPDWQLTTKNDGVSIDMRTGQRGWDYLDGTRQDAIVESPWTTPRTENISPAGHHHWLAHDGDIANPTNDGSVHHGVARGHLLSCARWDQEVAQWLPSRAADLRGAGLEARRLVRW